MNILTTLKQALEALERSKPIPCVYALASDATSEHEAAISNLSAAIEQIEKAEPLGFVETLVDDHVIKIMNLDVNMPLYTYPPDAQAEIERLTKERVEWNAEFKAAYKRETAARQQLAAKDRDLKAAWETNRAIDKARMEDRTKFEKQLAEREGCASDIPTENIAPFKYYAENNLFMIKGREWQLVPKEPTREMIASCWSGYAGVAEATYKAMLAAAPNPGDIE